MPVSRVEALLAFRQCGYPMPSDDLLPHLQWAIEWARTQPITSAAWLEEIGKHWSRAWGAHPVEDATRLMLESGLARIEMQGIKVSETEYATAEQFNHHALGVLMLPMVAYANFEHHGIMDEPMMLKHTRAAAKAIAEGRRSTLTGQSLRARTDRQ